MMRTRIHLAAILQVLVYAILAPCVLLHAGESDWPGPIPKPHAADLTREMAALNAGGFAVYSTPKLQNAPVYKLLMEELFSLDAGGAEPRLPGQGGGGLNKIVIGDLREGPLTEEAAQAPFETRHWEMIDGRDQAYLLSFSQDADGRALIALYGTDERGLYYGFLTLKQYLENCYRNGIALRAGVIADWPDFKERLLLEGGSDVWKQNLRMRRLALAADLKMSDYIYEPKGDFKTRRKWRAPYTDEELTRFAEIADFANARYLKVGYSLNVALSAHYSSEKTYNDILSKFRAVRARGIRHFGLFFDDSPPNLPTQADRDRYGRIGLAQADLANRVREAMMTDDPEMVFYFCPTLYWSLDDVQYFRDMKKNLNESIKVGWTGREIVSPTITEEDAAGFRKLIGRPYAVGDNYPEYRWLPQRNRENGLYRELLGWMTNAPWLTEITIATVADYSWNAEGYDPDESLRRAVWRLSGPELFDVMLSIALASENAVLAFDEETQKYSVSIAPPMEIKTKLAATADAAGAGQPLEAVATDALNWLSKADSSIGRMRETVLNDLLLKDLTGSLYLDELGKYCSGKRGAIERLLEAEANGGPKSEILEMAAELNR